MTRTYFFLSAMLAFFLGAAGLTAASAALLLEKIDFDASGANVDRITFQMNSAELPKHFTLKAPPRLVFDFPETALKKGLKTSLPAEGKFIKGIRTAEHRGDKAKTRVVLDLASEQGIEYRQDFNDETNTLVISVFAAGTEPAPAVATRKQPPPVKPAAAMPPPPATVKSASEPAPLPQPEETAATAKPAPEEDARKTEAKAAPALAPAEKEEAAEPDIAAIPRPGPDAEEPVDEATVIQPLSEIGPKKAGEQDGKPPVLQSIAFEKNGSKGETINFQLNTFNPPVVFGIEEESPRIVCFFKDTTAGENLPDTVEAKGRFVKSIKVGKYSNPDNIRVVMDLVPNQNYDLQQVFFKEENMFMIIINTTGEKSAGQ